MKLIYNASVLYVHQLCYECIKLYMQKEKVERSIRLTTYTR